MIHDGRAVVSNFVSAGLVLGVPVEPERVLELASQPSKFTRRDFEPGHFTASAVLADGDTNRAFLIRHPKLERWLQPGGHIEPTDTSIAAAAAREAEEETGFGVDRAAVVPVALSIHRIPAWGREPSHLHLDLQFLFRLAVGSSRSDAELGGRWFSLDSPEAAGAFGHTRERIELLLQVDRNG